jgi:hypothetical protein
MKTKTTAEWVDELDHQDGEWRHDFRQGRRTGARRLAGAAEHRS